MVGRWGEAVVSLFLHLTAAHGALKITPGWVDCFGLLARLAAAVMGPGRIVNKVVECGAVGSTALWFDTQVQQEG